MLLIMVGIVSTSFSQGSSDKNNKSEIDTLCLQDSVLAINDSIHSINDTIAANDTVSEDSLKKTPKTIDVPVKYQSTDSIRFYVKQKKISMYGSGNINYGDITLKAEHIDLNVSKKEVYARGKIDSTKKQIGKPNFAQGKEVFDADSLSFNFDSKKGLAYGIFTKQDQGYLHSEKTKILPDKEVDLQNGKFTTCDLPDPHFYVAMTKAMVIPNDKIVSGPVYLVIEGVPIPAILPFGFFPNRKGRASGIILPTFGDDATRGFYFKGGGFYFGISNNMDLQLTGDVYTLGSWRSEAKSNYVERYKYRGSFDFTYARLVDNEILEAPTFNIIWNHQQDPKAHPNSSFNASVNYGSVGFARNNARSQDEFLNNSISSSISYTKTFPNTPFNASIALTHHQNLLDSTIDLTLPHVTLSMSSISPFKRKKAVGEAKWYENIRVGYSLDGEEKLSGDTMNSSFYTKRTLQKFQGGIKNTIPISTSLKFLKYFSLNPNANINDRLLFDKVEESWDEQVAKNERLEKANHPNKSIPIDGVRNDTIHGIYNVWDYNVGANLTTTIYGMYNFKSKVIKALRHKMTPSVGYNFTPDFGSSKYGYWSKYKDSLGTLHNYSYFQNSLYTPPSMGKQSSVTLNLSNNLELKVRNRKDTVTYTKKITLIENLQASMSYNFAADSMNWSVLSVTGNTNLFKRVNVQYGATFDPYALRYDSREEAIVRARTLLYDQTGSFLRPTDAKWTFSTSYHFGPVTTNDKNKNIKPGNYKYYSDFDIPWSLDVSYNIFIPRTYYYTMYGKLDSVQTKVVQTMGVNGTVNLTKNLKATFSTGWDFIANKITYTTVKFYRDLHCWEMTFNWIPMGQMKRFEFCIRVKASMFQDLKLEKKQNYGTVIY